MKLKELQTEGREHRYEHVYKKKKEFSIEKKRKRSEDQKRYMESKGNALRKQRTKPKKLKDVESSKTKAKEYAKHDKFVAASRCRLYKLVKKKGIKKGGRTVSLIGCNRHDFLVHLTSQLRPGESMDDHTVDHIFPLDSYDLHDPVQLSKAFSYKNTQPLTMRENTSKGARLPTKAMAEKVPVGFWPEGVTMQELKDIYNGWANGLRLHTSDVLLSRRVD
jgi:5-methylcytosine-specific restriction endonuclease McrA